MVEWHPRLNERELEPTPGDSGQRNLACCCPRGRTQLSDWTTGSSFFGYGLSRPERNVLPQIPGLGEVVQCQDAWSHAPLPRCHYRAWWTQGQLSHEGVCFLAELWWSLGMWFLLSLGTFVTCFCDFHPGTETRHRFPPGLIQRAEKTRWTASWTSRCIICVPPGLSESSHLYLGLPRWPSGKESTCQCRRRGFYPWVGKIPWRRKWQPTPVFLPGKSHGQRGLVGYSPWGHRVTHD